MAAEKAASLAISPDFKVSVRYDFTVKRLSDSMVKVIFWVTFAFFVLSTPTQWLTSWTGWQFPEQVAGWMYTTFGVQPGNLLTEPWTLITHMFMHGGTVHFGLNMLMLYGFYTSAKEFFPSKSWLIVYFASGIAGGLAWAVMNSATPNGLMVGASGGIMGLWGAAIAARIRYQRVPADERPWQCSFTLKSLLIFLALQAVTEFLVPNVAHSAHAGGMLVGLVIGFLLPLCQQPRLVTGREGALGISATFADSHLGKMVSTISLMPMGDFDTNRDFIAVEYDRVDWRNRRSVTYVVLCGTMPDTITEANLIFVASARQVGSDTALQFARRLAEAEGKPLPEAGVKKKITSYAVSAMIVVYLVLGQVALAPQYLPLIAAAAALVATLMWFQIFNVMVGEVKKSYRAMAFVVAVAAVTFGGGLTIAWMCGETEFGVRLLVSLAAGHVIQRYIILPIQLRRAGIA